MPWIVTLKNRKGEEAVLNMASGGKDRAKWLAQRNAVSSTGDRSWRVVSVRPRVDKRAAWRARHVR